ncbi:MAG: Maf family protein [Lachnospiraceae bacterium]|nr:Maf family protein [Lachnospiraceae bacterium]
MKDIILASTSPRRKELLSLAGFPFTVDGADIDENLPIKDPVKFVEELSYEKAMAVAKKYPDSIVIGADTIVVIDDEILGKPKDEEDALKILKKLSGRTHQVYTGVTVLDMKGGKADRTTFHERTDVSMYENPESMLKEYISTGEPMDKAGAYGIQGRGALLIKGIEGDYYNVMGFPVAKIYRVISGM